MKFITEGDLRELYKKEPFTSYNLKPDSRLTPGARQFLADRGIYMLDKNSGNKRKTAKQKVADSKKESNGEWKNVKLFSKLKSIEALFFLTAEELLSKNILLAQETIKLSKQFSMIKNAMKSNSPVECLSCKTCDGINEENFSNRLEDCFEISEFHIQLEKSRDILMLHWLRCNLQEIEPLVVELSSNEEDMLFSETIKLVNQIINSITQLICSLVGGEKCQKQN